MQGIVYEETSILYFLFITVIIAGTGAWMTGRACAMTWRPVTTLVIYLVLLGAATRFIHFSIFNGTLLSAQYYIADTIVLLLIGIVAFQYTRTNQMVTQYYWLYQRSGPISWTNKG